MYAIIRTGGKQYKVQAGDTLKIEKLDQALGSELDLTEVLMLSGGEKQFIGKPLVANAKVTVVVTKQDKAPKVIVFKKKRRQGYRRLRGFRQMFTEIFIKSITTPEGQIIKTDKDYQVVDVKARAEEKMRKIQEEKRARIEARLKGATHETTEKKVIKKVAKKKVAKKKVAKKKSSKKVSMKKGSAKKAKKK